MLWTLENHACEFPNTDMRLQVKEFVGQIAGRSQPSIVRLFWRNADEEVEEAAHLADADPKNVGCALLLRIGLEVLGWRFATAGVVGMRPSKRVPQSSGGGSRSLYK